MIITSHSNGIWVFSFEPLLVFSSRGIIFERRFQKYE